MRIETLTPNTMSKPPCPLWFKIVAVVAVLWNIMGLTAFIFDIQMTPEELAEMELHPAMEEAYLNSPTWNWIAYGVATICGFLGSVMLLLRKKIALPILGLSLLGVLVQFCGSYLMTDLMSALGATGMIMPVMIVIIAIYLYFLSHKAKKAGWLV